MIMAFMKADSIDFQSLDAGLDEDPVGMSGTPPGFQLPTVGCRKLAESEPQHPLDLLWTIPTHLDYA